MVLPLEERVNAYKEVERLLQLNLQQKEIVHKIMNNFSVGSATVYQWLRGGSPYGERAGRVVKIKELFYVIGALLGDGYIYFWRNTFRAGLSVRDETFARRFAQKLSKIVKRRVKYYHYIKRDLWFVAIQNAELFFIFKNVRKDLSRLYTLLRAGDFNSNTLEFLQGFCDAEGCVKFVKEKSRKTPKVVIDITNKNLDYLEFAGSLFKKVLKTKPHFSSQFDKRRNSTYHHLRFYKKADVKKILRKIKTTKNRNPRLVRRLLYIN